jgi:predicted small lipoprotein YifL
MKKTLAIMLAIGLAVSVSACQRKDANSVPPAKVEVKAEKVEPKKSDKKAPPLTLEDVNRKAVNALVRVKKLEDLAKKAGLQ